MGLAAYKKKRSFTKTSEPQAGKCTEQLLRFVVQKHAASHLHYDFRLELGGVLKSWVLPKGPSLDPTVKRLAMMVNDHLYDYRNFEGIIPQDEYGGGTIIIWDEGVYEPSDIKTIDVKKQEKHLLHQLHTNKLKFKLKGKKLKGEFALVKTHGKDENAWLLIKIDDNYASKADVLKKDKSVISKKTVAQLTKIFSKKNHLKTTKRKPILNSKDTTQLRKINNHEIKFTNLNKLYWPIEKITKRDLINYYFQIAPYILPYLNNRPQSLNRYPNGINGKSFYQKDVTGKVPDWIDTYMYHTEENEEDKHFLLGNNEATLLYIINMGCIEINTWSSTVKKPDNPTWCIIDLDPDQNSFNQVIEAAQVTKQVLDDMQVPCYCKTSGSTGLHIYIPLGNKYTYEQSKEFARIIVTLVNQELPNYTTLERIVANRQGKMYLDFLQNRPQATIAATYSVRPKPGATVSMPLQWDEVKKGLKMKDFNIYNAVKRVDDLGDIFKPVLEKGIDLKKIFTNYSIKQDDEQ